MSDAEFREQVRAADELQDLSDQFEAAVERSQGAGRTLDALKALRDAIASGAVAAERERIAAEIGRKLTDARIEDLMRQHAIPLHGRGISVDLQARGVAASVRAAALAIVESKP